MKKVLNSNSLKFIAIGAMLLDHLAYAFFAHNLFLYIIFRTIGRITAPIMFFMLANGYSFTRSKFNYGRRLILFALISQIPYSLFIANKVFLFNSYNILFTLFLGFLCLVSLYDVKNKFLKIFFILVCTFLSYFCEYGPFAIALILMFSICKDVRIRNVCFSLICVLYLFIKSIIDSSLTWFIVSWGMFLVIPLLNLYNGEKGHLKVKYLFYVFYPAHLLILVVVKSFVL